jgi:hypothetical protein
MKGQGQEREGGRRLDTETGEHFGLQDMYSVLEQCTFSQMADRLLSSGSKWAAVLRRTLQSCNVS